jgi:hypothetical protein
LRESEGAHISTKKKKKKKRRRRRKKRRKISPLLRNNETTNSMVGLEARSLELNPESLAARLFKKSSQS